VDLTIVIRGADEAAGEQREHGRQAGGHHHAADGQLIRIHPGAQRRAEFLESFGQFQPGRVGGAGQQRFGEQPGAGRVTGSRRTERNPQPQLDQRRAGPAHRYHA
jgi:hypothetical protein